MKIIKKSLLLVLLSLVFILPIYIEFKPINNIINALRIFELLVIISFLFSFFLGIVSILTKNFYIKLDNAKEIFKEQNKIFKHFSFVLIVIFYLFGLQKNDLIYKTTSFIVVMLYPSFIFYKTLFLGDNYLIYNFREIKIDNISHYQIISRGFILKMKSVKLTLQNGRKFKFNKLFVDKDVEKIIRLLEKKGITKK
ncbi:MAG: hypothetical protein ACQERJ_02020 [Bacillota bacterium]